MPGEPSGGEGSQASAPGPEPKSPIAQRMSDAERVFIRINIAQTVLALAGSSPAPSRSMRL